MGKNLHILHIPRTYPSVVNPIGGIFFKEQAEAVAENKDVKIGVLSIIQNALFSVIFIKQIQWLCRTINIRKDNVNLLQRYVFTIPMPYRLKLNYRCFIGIQLFKKYLKVYGKPDLLHLQTYEMGWLASKIKRKYNIPYIVTEHSSNLYHNMPGWLEHMVSNTYHESEANIAVSEGFKEKLAERFGSSFIFIPNIVDVDYFRISKDIKQTTVYQFLHVGNCVPVKQQTILIDAFYKAFKGKLDVKLIIGGDGPELLRLKRQSYELGMSNQIEFTGALTKDEVRKYMQNSDAFVLSSKLETFGIVLIEAMACGLPCVSTLALGPESIINDSKLGELCENNTTSLSEAMIKVYKGTYDKNLIREYVVSKFSRKAVGDRILSVYNNINH